MRFSHLEKRDANAAHHAGGRAMAHDGCSFTKIGWSAFAHLLTPMVRTRHLLVANSPAELIRHCHRARGCSVLPELLERSGESTCNARCAGCSCGQGSPEARACPPRRSRVCPGGVPGCTRKWNLLASPRRSNCGSRRLSSARRGAHAPRPTTSLRAIGRCARCYPRSYGPEARRHSLRKGLT